MFLVVSGATLSRGSRRPKASLNCFHGLSNALAELLLEIFRFFGGMARNKDLQRRHARPWVAHGNALGQVWIGHGSGMDQGMDRNPMIFWKILVLQDLHCNSMNLGKTTGLSQTNKAGTVCRVTGSKPRKPQKTLKGLQTLPRDHTHHLPGHDMRAASVFKH